jgi:16S rRNA (cytosine967-C5)-methyltransferase
VNPGRIAAFERLEAHAASWPRIDPPSEELPSLEPRDAALARNIERQSVRRWLTLKAVLERQLTRPWSKVEPPLQAALIGGAAQLLLMDRIPEHAAVDETVEWAKRRLRPGAGGLVNAVLRGVSGMREARLPAAEFAALDPEACDTLPLDDGGGWKLRRAIFSASPPERLAQRTGLPLHLLLRWINRFGMAEARDLAMHTLAQPPIVVHGLPTGVEGAEQLAGTDAAVWTGDHAQLLAALEANPAARVQDLASARAVECTRDLKPSLIVDACAGRGTKSIQLARLHPSAEVVASEPDDRRRASLHETANRAARTGMGRIRVAEGDDLRDLLGKVDLLVLDVPCSNTGVLPRRVEAVHRMSPASMDSLVKLQRSIAESHLPLLKPGGALLYATCSLEPEENERQAEWLTARLGRVQPTIERLMPAGLPGGAAASYRDGAFVALWTGVSPQGKLPPASR